MDQLVMHDHIHPLGHTGKEPRIRIEARIKQQSGGGIVEIRERALEGLGVDAVAVEEAGAAGSEARGGGGEVREEGGVEGWGAREREEVVGGEVGGGGGDEGETAEEGFGGALGEVEAHGSGEGGFWFCHV